MLKNSDIQFRLFSKNGEVEVATKSYAVQDIIQENKTKNL